MAGVLRIVGHGKINVIENQKRQQSIQVFFTEFINNQCGAISCVNIEFNQLITSKNTGMQ
jgi:hypothetical protein